MKKKFSRDFIFFSHYSQYFVVLIFICINYIVITNIKVYKCIRINNLMGPTNKIRESKLEQGLYSNSYSAEQGEKISSSSLRKKLVNKMAKSSQ